MGNQLLRKYKWFWAWQDDKEEAWLRDKSQSGWHLVSARPFGEYTFISGEPLDYVYRLDYQTSNQKDRDGYLQLFTDAGWEYIDHMAGWQYFRKLNQPGEMMDIFSDTESKVQKYQRVIALLVIFLPILMMIFLSTKNFPNSFFTFIISLIYIVLMTLYAFSIIKIIQRINQLKKLK